MNKRVVIGIVIFLSIIALSIPVSIKIFKTYFSNNSDDKIVINIGDLSSDNSANDQMNVDSLIEQTSNDRTKSSLDVKSTENVSDDAVIEPIKLDGDDFTVTQNKTNITLDGKIIKRTKNQKQGLNTGSYVTFKIYVPKNVSKEAFENIKISLPQSGNIVYTEKEDRFLESKNSSKPYFYITQEFMIGQIIPIIIDWGDSKPTTYNFTFNLEVA